MTQANDYQGSAQRERRARALTSSRGLSAEGSVVEQLRSQKRSFSRGLTVARRADITQAADSSNPRISGFEHLLVDGMALEPPWLT